MSLSLRLSASTPSIKHFVDIIYDVDALSVDMDRLRPVLREKAWAELPEVLTLKIRPTFDYVSQFFIVPQVDEGKVCVVKHYYVKADKIKGSYVARLARGTAYEVSWSSLNKQKARRGFQWLLEQLGGIQFRSFSLSAEKRRPASTRAPPGEDEQDAGWDYIIQSGERDKGNLKQLRWIHRNINREGSPIHGWNEKLVQRALDSLANDGCLATLCDRYDLTIAAIEPPVLEILESIVPFLRGHALWMLGEPGVGKTPLGRILAMMFSRYHNGAGTFRTASDFDFFRGIFFDKTVPALYDDGEIGNEATKKKKAFSDVGDQETILKERWTAAKFVQHQLRIVIDNQYDPTEEPTDDGMPHDLQVAHASFLKIVKPAIGYIPTADSMAILKRAVFLVFTKNFIYFRPPSERPVPVERMRWSQRDILTSDCKVILKNYKAGGDPPTDYTEKTLWEAEWLKEAIRKHDAGPDHFASSPPPSAPLPGIKMEPQEFVDAHAWLSNEMREPLDVETDRASVGWSGFPPVKKEQNVFRSLAASNVGIIELDTPSPKRPSTSRSTSSTLPPNPDRLPGLPPNDEDEFAADEAMANLMCEE